MGSSSRDDKEARAERALATLTRTAFLNAASWSVCQTANLAIGVQLAPSRAALLTAMSFVMTASSTMQFFTLPLAGALSDRFGRKPLLLARQLSTSLMNCMLALRPSYALFLLARTAAMFSYHIGDTAQSAALADVSEGRQLAVSMARMRTMMGMAMLVGPAAGGRLAEYSLRLCIGLGGVIGATNFLQILLTFEETLSPADRAKAAARPLTEAVAAGSNPLGFVKLFRCGRTLGLLTVVSALQSTVDGTWEIDKHYAQEVAGLSLRQDGFHQSLRGLASMTGGWLVPTLLQPSRLGASEFTALTSAATVVYLGLKAAARGPSLFFASLLLYPLGGMNRGCAVDALHTRHALAAGMSRGELSAALANFKALLSAVTPMLFSTLYTRSGVRGSPYYLCIGMAVVAQLLFTRLPAAALKLEDRPPLAAVAEGKPVAAAVKPAAAKT